MDSIKSLTSLGNAAFFLFVFLAVFLMVLRIPWEFWHLSVYCLWRYSSMSFSVSFPFWYVGNASFFIGIWRHFWACSWITKVIHDRGQWLHLKILPDFWCTRNSCGNFLGASVYAWSYGRLVAFGVVCVWCSRWWGRWFIFSLIWRRRNRLAVLVRV